MRLLALCMAVVAAAALNGCATYAPRPLPQAPHLLADTQALETAVHAQSPAAQFDPDDGLNAAELARAAVITNPMLRATRAQHAVAAAKLYKAGLLPDPTLSASVDIPTPIDAIGYVVGIISDAAVAIITRGARKQDARQALRQVDLQLLWMQWQVAQQARMLFTAVYYQDRKIAVASAMLGLYRQRYRRSSQALSRGDLTIDVTGTDLTALLNASSQLNQLRQTQVQNTQDMAALLGLAPDAKIRLTPPGGFTGIPPELARKHEADVANRRPDLLALQAGYASQQAKVRTAILGQFPPLSVGVNRQQDFGGGSKLVGLSVDVGLPLFSGNRGVIAIERATRAQLRAEYQARLDGLPGDVARLLQTQSLLQNQQKLLHDHLPVLQTAVNSLRRAYARGDVDALTTLNLENTLLNKRLEALNVAQQLWNTRYALETLLALPPASGVPEIDNHVPPNS